MQYNFQTHFSQLQICLIKNIYCEHFCLAVLMRHFLVTTDIDECTECHNAGCEQVCINTIGDFLCDCWIGYRLTEDLYNCTGECNIAL